MEKISRDAKQADVPSGLRLTAGSKTEPATKLVVERSAGMNSNVIQLWKGGNISG